MIHLLQLQICDDLRRFVDPSDSLLALPCAQHEFSPITILIDDTYHMLFEGKIDYLLH